MESSGQLESHRLIVWAAVVASEGGLTAAELGARTGLGHHEAQRRLSGLMVERPPKVKKRNSRKVCSVKGTKMATWWPVWVQGQLA